MREWLMPQRFADVVHRLVRQPSKLDRWVRLPSSAYYIICRRCYNEKKLYDIMHEGQYRSNSYIKKWKARSYI